MTNRITAITAQKRNPQRVNIFLDGSYGFSLSRIVAAWLSVGQSLDETTIQSLQGQDEYEVAFQRAARYLNYRARTTQELKRKISDLGFSEQVTESVLSRCQELRMLDDAEFAQTYVHFRVNNRPRSKRLMRLELRAKGISEELIQCALAEIQDEELLAYDTAKIYCKRLTGLPYDQFQQKLMGYLSRRGFAYQESRQIVQRVWRELQSEHKHSLSYMNEGDDV